MTDFDTRNLKDLSHATIVTKSPIYRTEHESRRNGVENRASALNDYWRAREGNFAGSAHPVRQTRGKVWFDTGTNFWKGDPDGNNCDDAFATRLTAYQHSFATAGTDTFKAKGAVTDTTAVTLSATTGQLMSKTITANSLSANGNSLRVIGYGTKTLTADWIVDLRFGQTPISLSNFGGANFDAAVVWIGIATITRISSSSIRVIARSFSDTDAGLDSVCFFNTESSDVDFSANQTLDFYVSANGTGSLTQEGMIVEYLI